MGQAIKVGRRYHTCPGSIHDNMHFVRMSATFWSVHVLDCPLLSMPAAAGAGLEAQRLCDLHEAVLGWQGRQRPGPESEAPHRGHQGM